MTGFQKRSHDRHTLSLYMEVFEEENYSSPLFKCRTNNIGIGGLMIHKQGQKIPRDANLNVLLKASCKSGLKEFPVDAKIVWETSDAIGMQIFLEDESKQKNFKRFLFESKVAMHSIKRRQLQKNTEPGVTINPSSRSEGMATSS